MKCCLFGIRNVGFGKHSQHFFSENDERYQLDATIVIYYRKYLYMFRASICPSSGVQVVSYCTWRSALGVVAVVLSSRYVVLCTYGHTDARNT